MQTFSVQYFDGKSPQPRAATLVLGDDFVRLEELGLTYQFNEISISPKLGKTPQHISFPDGASCILGIDDTFILPNDSISPFVLRLESKLKYALIAFVLLGALAVWMMTAGTTLAANFLADKIPQSIIDDASRQAFEILDEEYMQPSNISRAEQMTIEHEFERIFGRENRIHFRYSKIFGANAFALPNGDIILLDDLIKLEKDDKYRGIIAILAHENGHVVYQHGLKNIIKSSITSAFIGYLIGDFSSFLASISAGIINAQYSREFETQADQYAIDVMKHENISTKYMADIFEALMKKEENSSAADKLFGSHPQMQERIKALRK